MAERIKAGIQNAKAKGVKMGKSTVHSIIQDYAKGLIDKDGFVYEKPLLI